MKFKSALITEASGSIAGMTASRNAGGNYLRARVIPINPQSTFQQAVRAALALLATAWVSTLTDVQRQAWKDYAANVPLTDTLGDTRHRSGIAHFIRANVPRLEAGLTSVIDGPTQFIHGPTPNPAGIELTGSAETLSLEGNIPIGAPSQDGTLFCYMGVPQNPSRGFYKGPWRFMDKQDFSSGDEEVAIAFGSFPFATAAGQRVSFRFTTSLATGQLSAAGTVALIVPG